MNKAILDFRPNTKQNLVKWCVMFLSTQNTTPNKLKIKVETVKYFGYTQGLKVKLIDCKTGTT